MAGLRVHVVMDRELVERIDAALLGESRGEFVRRAVEQALAGGARDGVEDSGSRSGRGQPGNGGVAEPDVVAGPAAPAEQPRREREPRPVTDALSGVDRTLAFQRAEAARKAALKR